MFLPASSVILLNRTRLAVIDPVEAAEEHVLVHPFLRYTYHLSFMVRRGYPFHDWTATVTHCGRICYKRRKINLSQVFAGQNVGVRQVSDRVWLVTFMHYDLGYFDDETCRLEPIENPFGPKVLPMCPE